MSALGSFLMGEGEQTRQFPRFTPQQQQVLSQLLQGAGGLVPSGINYLQNILGSSPEAFEAFEAPTRRAFEERTVPTLAERFSALGGGQRSSAFGQQLAQAGTRLEEALGAQRAGLQGQALAQLQSLLGLGTTPQFETAFSPRQPGFLENIGTQAASFLPLLLL